MAGSFHKLSLALLALAAAAAVAAAADAPYGAYLGCFSSSITNSKSEAGAELSGCAGACNDKGSGILLITTDSKCYCSNSVPDDGLMLEYADCQAGGSGVAAFYLHKDASTTQCRLSNPRMTQAWNIVNGKADVQISGPENMVTLRLANPSGARLENKDGKFLYGMIQIEGKTTTELGAVTTFYTRSSDVYPNEAAGEYSEIDWEFCNGPPCKQAGLWLNSYSHGKSNGERLVTVEEYQKLLGSNGRTDTGFMVYTLNWQPDSLSWAVNDTVVQIRRNGESVTWNDMGGRSNTVTFKSPDLPQNQIISIWTDNRAPPDNWGGVLDFTNAPFYSHFKNFRRVICDSPLPENDPTVMGPAWLYGKAETAAPKPVKSPSLSPAVDESVKSFDDTDSTLASGQIEMGSNVGSDSSKGAVSSSDSPDAPSASPPPAASNRAAGIGATPAGNAAVSSDTDNTNVVNAAGDTEGNATVTGGTASLDNGSVSFASGSNASGATNSSAGRATSGASVYGRGGWYAVVVVAASAFVAAML